MKILAICPSIYPNKLEKMLDSFSTTVSPDTSMRIIDENTSTITKIFNKCFEQEPDYDFYFMANDDIIFKTPLWDLSLANKGKISWGSDGIQNGNLCTFPMIDGNIVRALGWLQCPYVEKYSGDQAWMVIGKIFNILEYHPEVIIEHQWEGWDEIQGRKDLDNVNKWANSSMRDDIERVRRVLCLK